MGFHVSSDLRRLNHLHGELDSVYHAASLRLGLSDSAMCILYTICLFGDRCPLGGIVQLSGLSKQTINSSLRKLEAEGILYLEPSGPRSKDVCLTQDGQRIAAESAQRLLAAENAVFAGWPAEDVRQYLALSERYLNDLKAQIENF